MSLSPNRALLVEHFEFESSRPLCSVELEPSRVLRRPLFDRNFRVRLEQRVLLDRTRKFRVPSRKALFDARLDSNKDFMFENSSRTENLCSKYRVERRAMFDRKFRVRVDQVGVFDRCSTRNARNVRKDSEAKNYI